MRLCLVGMSGVGKSFWAKRLAARGWTRHDCDGAIGARLASVIAIAPGEEPVHALGRWMGMPWSAGYPEREARYLALEEAVTREALDAPHDPAVIDATGSVIYLSEELQRAIRARCRVVYLRTPEHERAAMLRRYLEEPKPVVWAGAFAADRGEPPEHALPRCYEQLLAIRDERYRALAHVIVDGAALEASDPGLDGFLALAGAQ